MNFAGRFIEWAHADTVGTIRAIFGPEGETLFGIHIPLMRSGLVRNITTFRRHFALRYGSTRAVPGAFFTDIAELLYAKRLVGVVAER